jgi:hypothetical protein
MLLYFRIASIVYIEEQLAHVTLEHLTVIFIGGYHPEGSSLSNIQGWTRHASANQSYAVPYTLNSIALENSQTINGIYDASHAHDLRLSIPTSLITDSLGREY